MMQTKNLFTLISRTKNFSISIQVNIEANKLNRKYYNLPHKKHYIEYFYITVFIHRPFKY